MRLKFFGIYCIAVPLLALLGFATPAKAQTFTVLHNFNTSGGDGTLPTGSMVLDTSNNLYGTTPQGGSSAYGTVFKLDTSGNNYSVLYSFKTNGGDGTQPYAGLIMDASGNFYGTTPGGGTNSAGTVFKITPAGSETILYSFCPTTGCPDGQGPRAGLIMDASGNLYGTTLHGGASTNGTVFKLDSSRNETVLYTFMGNTDGYTPGPLIMDTSGNLYGVNADGGTSDYGTVFKVDAGGNFTVLHTFGNTDGASPMGNLVMDASGNLYGATYGGGVMGNGTVFKLDPSGNLTVLHSFNMYSSDGAYPMGGLIMDASGNLYGTTMGGGTGGSSGNGIVFKIGTSGNGYTVLHSFLGSDGGGPVGCLVMDSSGNLYGTTEYGGAYMRGTVFKISAGSAPAVLLSASSLDFGNILINATSAVKTVTVTNSGNSGLTFAAGAVTLSGTNAADFAISADGCSGQTVAASATCSVGVTFTASAAASETATLKFADNASDSPQSVTLTGTGVALTVAVSPASLTFASQVVGTTSAAQTVTLSNTGSGALTITSISTNLADFIETNNCGTSLAASSNCTISVTFKPSAAGAISGTLTIADNATGSPQLVTLTGTGTAPSLSVSPTTLNFNGVVMGATGAAQTVTLTNNSGVAVSITSIAATGDFAETNTCGSAVTANGNCTVSVTFKPTATGARSGTLSITDNAAGSPQTVPLSGTGEDFALSASASAKSVARGGTATFDLQVAPQGGFTGTVTLACAGQPSEATCTVSPASVTLNGSSSTTATVSVSTTASSRTIPLPPEPPVLPPAVLWVSLAALAGLATLARFGPRRAGRRGVLLALLAALLLAAALLVACGGGSTPHDPGTPTGTYPLTITGTSGSLTHTSSLSLTVQ